MPEAQSPVSRRKKQSKFANWMIGIGIFITIIAILAVIPVVEYKVYENKQYRVRIKYPSHWQVVDNVSAHFRVIASFVTPKETAMDTFQENVTVMITDLSQNPMGLTQFSKEVIAGLMDQPGAAPFVRTLKRGSYKVGKYDGYQFVFEGTKGNEDAVRFFYAWTVVGNRGYTFGYGAIRRDYDKYIGIVQTMLKSFELF